MMCWTREVEAGGLFESAYCCSGCAANEKKLLYSRRNEMLFW